MKKTLALLLALIMMLSMTMVSCNKEEEPDDTEDDFGFNFDDPTGEATGDSTDESGENNNNNSDFVAASGTSYILHPVKVRKDAKKSSSTIGVAAWGSAVELVERNTIWSKVKFTDADSGAKLEGYIRNELLTADKKQVTLVELEGLVNENRADTVITSVEKALSAYPEIRVSEPQAKRFHNGGSLSCERLKGNFDAGIYRVYSPDSKLLGLGEIDGEKTELAVRRVLIDE